MTKAYLVSEELLRHVLDALESRLKREPRWTDEEIASIDALRTLLSKEPNEPVCYVETDEDGDIAWDLDVGMSDDPSWFENPIPVYRKDT